jgi:methionyl-tRNA synthetase
VLELVSATNEYLERLEPWRRAKDPTAVAEVAATLFHAAEAVRLAAALLWPVVPELSGRILVSLGQPAVPLPEHLAWGVLDGGAVEAGPAIYQRLEVGAA